MGYGVVKVRFLFGLVVIERTECLLRGIISRELRVVNGVCEGSVAFASGKEGFHHRVRGEHRGGRRLAPRGG
jgi:hypothetical protein